MAEGRADLVGALAAVGAGHAVLLDLHHGLALLVLALVDDLVV